MEFSFSLEEIEKNIVKFNLSMVFIHFNIPPNKSSTKNTKFIRKSLVEKQILEYFHSSISQICTDKPNVQNVLFGHET